MAQHDYVISNGTGAAVRSDLNNALLAIVSQNSGATEPTTTYAYQWWADTTTGLLKIRNSANNAWITLRELDGTLTIEDGTVSAPGLAFRDDLNTGIWRPGTDQFAISTNGVERVEWGTSEVVFNDAGNNYDFRIEGDNNANLLFVDASADAVGIGSSSPVFLTDILSGTANTGANVNNPSQLSVTGPNKSLTGGGATVFINSNTDLAVDTGGSIALSGRNTTSSTNSVVWGVVKGAKENATSGNTAGYLAFASANHAVGSLVEAMRIDSSQRVGIGATTVGDLLHLRAATTPHLRIDHTTTSSFGAVQFYEDGTQQASIGALGSTSGGTGGGNALQIWNFLNAPTLFATNNQERARITSDGKLLLGTSSESAYSRAIFAGRSDGNAAGLVKLQSTNSAPASGDTLGNLLYGVTGATTTQAVAEIYAARDGGTWTNNSSMPGRLVFATTADGASSSTERMRINSAGDIGIGASVSTPGTYTNTGVSFGKDGYILASRSDFTVLYVNRKTSDGTLVEFAQADTVEGNISVSGTTVSYNGAHLSRWSQLPGGVEREEILRGSVLSNIDEMCEWGDEENEQLNRMKVSDVEGDKNVSGVFQAWDDDDDTYTNDFYCAMTGDFIIRIGAGVTVERGDLLMSAGDGTAKPQDDDIIRSKTIAKVTSTNVSCTYEDGSYCVPCVLMAC